MSLLSGQKIITPTNASVIHDVLSRVKAKSADLSACDLKSLRTICSTHAPHNQLAFACSNDHEFLVNAALRFCLRVMPSLSS